MKNNLIKKLPIYLGLIFVLLDFVFFQYTTLYECYLNSPICGENLMGNYIIHLPTSWLLSELTSLIEKISGQMFSGYDEYFLLIDGIIQSFLLGYLIGWVIRRKQLWIKNFM